MIRQCTKCGEEKELGSLNFYKFPRNQQGFHTQCKTCMVKKQKEYNKKEGINNNWIKMFIG